MRLTSFIAVLNVCVKSKGILISTAEPRINDRIRVAEIRLIGASGEQVGVVSID
ncbi:MAG: Translation initiation factor N-terminal domain, partial [Actinomycetota bacterium]